MTDNTEPNEIETMVNELTEVSEWLHGQIDGADESRLKDAAIALMAAKIDVAISCIESRAAMAQANKAMYG